MLLGLFSVTAHADSISTGFDISILIGTPNFGIQYGSGRISFGGFGGFDVTLTSIEAIVDGAFYGRLNLEPTSSTVLFEKGKKYTLYIDNIHSVFGYKIGSYYATVDTPSSVSFWAVYGDGTEGSVFIDYKIGEKMDQTRHYIEIVFTPDKDILRADLYEYFTPEKVYDFDAIAQSEAAKGNYGLDLYSCYGFHGSDAFSFKYDIQSEEVGLLSGILDWVKNIGNKVSDTFDVISSGFSNIGTWFAELPGKIWGFIEDGLKSLFVPSEEEMIAYSDKWEQLLADRFGAVYQVTNILTDSWDGVMAADQTNTINFPSVSINLPDNTKFSFGGYEVQIVPTGFDVLVNGVKLIIGIVATVAFVNGMRKKYDEVMGVEE